MGLDNTPSAQVMRNLTRLTDQLLDPMREQWGKPIVVTSGYRSPQLNALVGGAARSHHLEGLAADLVTLGNSRTQNLNLYLMIKYSSLPYRELIAEGLKHGGCDWVHVSL